MKITYLKTVGFRKFKREFETELYDVTDILGGNRKGKTNILYAIVWAFFGTNLTGDDKIWLGNNKSDDCYVELKFTDNFGINHTLVRYKNKYDNQKNFVLLDDKKAEPENIQTFCGEKKLFLSILNPNYFTSKKPAEQKKLLDAYLPELSMKVVYDKLDDADKKCLDGIPDNITEYLKELNSAETLYDDKIKNIRGKIEYAQNIANEKLEDKKTFEKAEELSLAMQELSFLTSKTPNIGKIEQQTIVNDLASQISQLEKQIKDLTSKMETGKKTYLSIKGQSIAHCPMCEQEIGGQSRTTTIVNMKKELELSFANRTKLEQDLSDLKSKLIVEKCKLHALEGIPNIEIEKQITFVQHQISILEQEKQEIEKHNNAITLKQQSIDEAVQNITNFKKQIIKYEKLIDTMKQTKSVAQKLFINYIEEKMKFATKHLKDVKIKYYSILKDTGELKEDFIITYKGNDFKNLSRSETIATSLELCNMLNQISNLNIPLFVDDSESCVDYDFVTQYKDNSQLLVAEVQKGSFLKIFDYSNPENCTIIKPVITGYRTMKLGNIIHNALQQVA